MPSRRFVLVAAAVAFVASNVMTNLESTVRQMHLPGGVSGAVTDIASPTTSGSDAERLVQSWRAWDDNRAAQADVESQVSGARRVQVPPGTLVGVWLLIDSLVFAPALALALAAAARRRQEAGPPKWLVWLALAPFSALIYLGFDVVENALTAGFVFGGWSHWFVRVAAGLKLFFVAATILPIVLSLVFSGGHAAPAGCARFRDVFARLRVPLFVSGVIVGLFVLLPGSVRPQLVDVVRTWTPDDDPASLWWALLGLAGLTTAVYFAGCVALRTTDAMQTGSPNTGWGVFARVAGGLALIGATAAVESWTDLDVGSPLGYVVGGGVLLNAIGYAIDGQAQARPAAGFDGRPALAAATAAPALALCALVLASADITGPWDAKWLAFLVAAGLFVAFLAIVMKLPEVPTPPLSAGVAISGGIGAIGALACAAIVADLIESSWMFGAVAIVMLGFTVVTGALALAEAAFRRPPQGLLAVLGAQRAPLLLSVIGAFLVTGAVSPEFDFHRVRTAGDAGAEERTARRRVDLTDAVATWTSTTDRDAVVPMFVIASSGGGARAAYWTLLTTNCLFGGALPSGVTLEPSPCAEPVAWERVLFASGISGGSVGLAMYEAARESGASVVDTEVLFEDGGVDPVIASMMLVDLPNGYLAHDSWPDRAVRLEEAWEKKLPAMGRGFYETQLASDGGALQPTLPVLLLNSAAVEDGCRINVSTLDLVDEPRTGDASTSCRSLSRYEAALLPEDGARPLAATRDIDDFVCGDMRLSTAALLSARFPFVSPTGTLSACADANVPDGMRTYAGDGGYVDSSAASPLVELIDAAVHAAEAELGDDEPGDDEPGDDEGAPCVQPVVLQIDNGYARLTQPADGSRPRQLVAPLAGFGASAGSHADSARQALAMAARPRCTAAAEAAGVDAPGSPGRPTYVHLYPRARPGIEAPLGWSLSQASRDDLQDQLVSPENRAALCHVARWLTDASDSCPRLEAAPEPFAATARLADGFVVVALLVVVALGVLALIVWISRSSLL